MSLTLLSLVGEQPMPVLLPARYLQPKRHLLVCTGKTRPVAERIARLSPASEIVYSEAYALEKLLPAINKLCTQHEEPVINLTGGTKFMAMAAFAIALQHNLRFVYLESERSKSTLYSYTVAQNRLQRQPTVELPPLITAADYLNAHLPGFGQNGFSRDEQGQLNSGGLFEQTVYHTLTSHFEVLAGIQPSEVDQQIEIDLVIRHGNQVGIAELKLGDREGEKPKQGIDQLSTAGSREYLGTYTAKFLITANYLPTTIQTLAQQKQVHWLRLSSYRNGRLSAADQQRLIAEITAKLTGVSL